VGVVRGLPALEARARDGRRDDMTDETLQRMDAFYDHLDACERCRERPFDPCQIGARLLKDAAAGLTIPEAHEADSSRGTP
jgi:Mn-dependent DtxR family transcriptional regulator